MVEFPPKGRIYCDANVWIYAVESIPPYSAHLLRLFTAVEEGAASLLTSELTVLEVLVKPLQAEDEDLQRAFEEALYSSEGVEVVPITHSVLVEAARMRAKHGFRVPDALHFATAVWSKVDWVLTNDVRWKSFREVPVLTLSEILEPPAEAS
ncbi:MAG: PIN domain-containing protein [Chloroflexi bacterium]|nr:PIN domain-containing protein [Chloroflexota bacterium]